MSCPTCGNGLGWIPPKGERGGRPCPKCNACPPLAAGGQGRTGSDVTKASLIVAACLVVAMALIALACALKGILK
jgi:hypothetical protein